MLDFWQSLFTSIRSGRTYSWIDPRTLRKAESPEDLVQSKDLAIWYPDGESQRQHLRRSPAAHIVPGGSRMLPSMDGLRFEEPPVFAMAASNCYHVGFRTILTEEGRAFNDDWFVDAGHRRHQAARFNSNIVNTDELTPLRAAEDLSEVTLTSKLKRIRKIPGTTIILTTDEPTNYGSFLFRATPKLLTLKAMKLAGTILVPGHYESMREYWSILGLEEGQYIRHDPTAIYQLERAVVVGNRNRQAYLDPESVELHRSCARPYFGGRPRKLFVSREALELTKSGYRRMINAEDVASALTGEGFEIITPETLPMAAQIEAFAAAEFVIGQSGGAMFNCAFCKPGTRVIDIESEPHWIHAHLCFMSSLDLSFSILEGQAQDCDRPYHLPFSVDVDALVGHLRAVSKN